MDFFVKYTELFVDEAKKDTSQHKTNIKNFPAAGTPARKNQQPGGRMRLEATTS